MGCSRLRRRGALLLLDLLERYDKTHGLALGLGRFEELLHARREAVTAEQVVLRRCWRRAGSIDMASAMARGDLHLRTCLDSCEREHVLLPVRQTRTPCEKLV